MPYDLIVIGSFISLPLKGEGRVGVAAESLTPTWLAVLPLAGGGVGRSSVDGLL